MAESGQVVVRPEGQDTCVHHKGRTLKLFCEKCQDVACTKCVTTVHKGHTMSHLSNISAGIAQYIRGFVEDTEVNKLPQSQKNIQSTIDELETNSEYFDNLAVEATSQAEILKQEIDIMTAETLSLYQQRKEDNTRLLSNYKRKLEEGHTKLRKQLRECKRLLQTASAVTLFDARDEVKRFGVQSSDKPILRSASFNPTKSYRGFLEKAFGTRTTSSESTSQVSPDSGQIHSFSSEVQLEMKHNPPSSKYRLLPEVRVLGRMHTRLVANALCCNQSRETHLCYPFTMYSEIHLFNTELKGHNNIRIDTKIVDISIARETNHIWAACNNDKSIIELISGSPIIRFRIDDTPKCLCVTMDNHVLVGTKGCITKFSMNGKVVLTTDKAKSEKCVVSDTKRIRECPVTRNVAVVDLMDTGVRVKQVLVLNKDLYLVFRYSGAISKGLHLNIKAFSPCSVAFDSVGNIVIADAMNCHILLLDGNCKFIKTIYESKCKPTAIDIDNDNILWVAYSATAKIERLQYYT